MHSLLSAYSRRAIKKSNYFNLANNETLVFVLGLYLTD